MKKIMVTILVTVAALATYQVIARGVTISERNECQQWHAQASSLPTFYATAWQKSQCAAYGITLTQ